MELPVNIRIALFSGETESSLIGRQVNRISAFEAALIAYKFLFRQFWPALRLLWLPIMASGVVLYLCLSVYLSKLLLFLSAPNPHTASLALGILAAGIFSSLFCYAIAVGAVADLALGRAPKIAWFHFRAKRQEWRIYAAYLRFLLLLMVVLVSVYLISTYLTPLFALPPAFFTWALTIAAVAAIVWLTARTGFLVAPIVATSKGAVLRKAWRRSAHDLWRNCWLILFLFVPGLLVEIAGEYLVRLGGGPLRMANDLPVADYARLLEQTLGGFLCVVSVAAFVTIVLMTVGGVAVYRNRPVADAQHRL
jgi:hypothetical protein